MVSVSALTLTPIRLFIIEPQPILANGLCSAIAGEHDVEMVGCTPAFDPKRLRSAMPSVVLVDGDVPSKELCELITACRRAECGHVCVLTSSSNMETMSRALMAGATGYILKDVGAQQLLHALRELVSCGFYADRRLSTLLVRRKFTETAMLSPREIDVVRLVAQGLSNKEIGDRLAVSDKTVKNHIANIFSKLNLNARTQVAVYAIREGIV